MEVLKKNQFISGGNGKDNTNSNVYIPDPGAAMIAIGTAVVGGMIGGAIGGPPGIITGGISGGAAAAIATVSIDAYNISKSSEEQKSK